MQSVRLTWGKIQVADYKGGITADAGAILQKTDRDHWHKKIGHYREIPHHLSDLLVLRGYGSILLSRGGTEATRTLKNRAAARSMIACHENADYAISLNSPMEENKRGEKVKRRGMIYSPYFFDIHGKVKKLATNEAFLKTHPLTLQYRHGKRKDAGRQGLSKYDLERLAESPMERIDLTYGRTGKFLSDMDEPIYDGNNAADLEKILKWSLGDIYFRTVSKNNWANKLPTQKAQDDFNFDYSSMRTQHFEPVSF